MVREELQTASENLADASDATDDADVAETLADQAEQLDGLAERDQGPDHGRLARHENVLADLAASTDGDVADLIEAALAEMRAYRETVEGV
ncbi:MAG: hypothetical protein V5A43_06865 [Haloarculaceae archaeon]